MGVRYTDDLFARKRQWKVQWQHQIDTFQLEGWRQVTSLEADFVPFISQQKKNYPISPHSYCLIELMFVRFA